MWLISRSPLLSDNAASELLTTIQSKAIQVINPWALKYQNINHDARLCMCPYNLKIVPIIHSILMYFWAGGNCGYITPCRHQQVQLRPGQPESAALHSRSLSLFLFPPNTHHLLLFNHSATSDDDFFFVNRPGSRVFAKVLRSYNSFNL